MSERMSTSTSRRRVVAATGVALALGALVTAQPSPSPAAARTGAAGAAPSYPAGLKLDAIPDRAQLAPLAASGSYDPDRVAEKYAEFQAAGSLQRSAARVWHDVGPLGVDSPTGYTGSAEQFLRVAGMGSALAADSNDATGNTVYFGNMGGLWKSTDGGDHWANLSDGKIVSAGVGAIALDPSRPGDIYVGTGISYMTISGDTYGTGFYVSHDGGQTFSRPSPNVEGWSVTVIRVTPTAVFVGTNHGLYRSTDHGDTLSLVSLPDNAAHTGPASGPYANWISDIAVKPGNANEVTVAVGFPFGKITLADGSIGSPGNGLYRSTAGGANGSFTAMNVSGLASTLASADPIGRIALAYGQTASDTGVLWAFVSDAGLADGLAIGDLPLPAQVKNPGSSVLNGLFRSTDDGATWTVKADPKTLLASPNSTTSPAALPLLNYAPGVQAYYENVLVTDPVVPDQVYFGLEEFFQTYLGANLPAVPAQAEVIERYADLCGFYLITPGLTNGLSCPAQTPLYGGYTTHPDQHAAIVVKTPNGARMYSANDGGVFRQDSHSTLLAANGFDNSSWTSLNTMPSVEAWHVALLPNGEVLAALQDNGVSLSGADRKGIQVGIGDGVWPLPSPDPNVFYIGIPGGSLFVTKDHGHNLTPIPPSLTSPSFLAPVAVDPTDPNHIVAAGRNVEESLKGPNTTVTADPVLGTVISSDWVQSFDAGPSPVTDPFSGAAVDWTATAMAVRGAPTYVAMCATCSAYRESFNAVHAVIATNVKPGCTAAKGGSACWHMASSKGLSPGYVGALVIDPTDTKTMYASIIERQFVGYPASRVPGRVFVSHDAGETFTDVTGNLPQGSVWRLVIRDGQLIAATDIGMFTSPAGSAAWSRLGTGLPAVAMRDTWIDPTGRYLLASAYGRGVWLLDFGAATVGSANPGPPAATQTLVNTAAPSPAGAVALLAIVALAVVPAVRRRRR